MARSLPRGLCCTIGAIMLAACGGAPAASTVANANYARVASAYDDSAPSGEAAARLEQAVELIDARELERAIAILEDLRRTMPHNGTVLHELGLAYRLSGRPERAVALLTPYSEALGVTATAALGSAVDEAGDPAGAETVLRRGIARHPHAGLLFSELAVVVGRQRRLDEAISLFVAGMAAEPAWPTNYLHAARLIAQSDAAGLALYWGEIFRLLEPASERSRQMASVMIDVLRARVQVGPRDANGEHSVRVRLAPGSAPATLNPGGVVTIPFVHALELGEGTTLAIAVVHGLSLASLHAMRADYLTSDARFPDTELFRWLSSLAAAGHLEAYDVWLYGPAFPDEASAWVASHRDEMSAALLYIQSHPFRPTVSIAPDAPVRLPARASEPEGSPQGPI